MLTEKDYCDYETCVALKELGYDGYCAAYYHLFDDDEDARNSFEHIYAFDFQNSNNIYRVGAPLLYQAQKWLREEKRICVEVDCCASGYTWELCKAYQGDWFSGGTTIYTHYCEDNYNNALLNDCGKYNSYEDALLEGIKEAVKILKEK